MPPQKSIKIKIKKIKIPKRSERSEADHVVEVEKRLEEIHETGISVAEVEVEVIIDIKRDLGPSQDHIQGRSIRIDPDQVKRGLSMIKMFRV
jgi:hypothetical protein